MKTLCAFILCFALTTQAAPVTMLLSWQDTNAIPTLPQYIPGSNDCYILVGTSNIATVPPIPTNAVLTIIGH